jgi:hypothetical protein
MRSFPEMPLALATFALMAMPIAAQTERLGVAGPIAFEGQDYALAWSAQPSTGYFKQEYVPEGQVVETYEQMFLVEAVTGPISPRDAAASQVRTLEARRGADPVRNYQLMQNETSGEVLLDFLISDLKADPVVVEWNAYRYVSLPSGEGVALFAISKRGYGDDGARAFMTALGEMRTEAINALAAYQLPKVTIAP